MAANRNANKIVYGAKTLIDLTTDTVQVQHPGKRGDAYALRIAPVQLTTHKIIEKEGNKDGQIRKDQGGNYCLMRNYIRKAGSACNTYDTAHCMQCD